MSKTNRQRITDLQDELENFEQRFEEISQELDDKKKLLDSIEEKEQTARNNSQRIKKAKNTVESNKKDVDSLKQEIQDIKEDLNQELNSAEVKKEDIDKFFTRVFGEKNEEGKREGGLKERLDEKEKELDEYLENSREQVESFLENQEQKYDSLYEKIESLLPGAAATGLAKAFGDQKQKYNPAKSLWFKVFLVAIIGLVLTGITIIYSQGAGEISNIFMRLALKSPFLIAFIWLGTFAASRYKESNRIQEEYAHKEALAKAYMGYREDFSDSDKASKELDKALIEALRKNPGDVLDEFSGDERPGIFNQVNNNAPN